MTIPNITPDIAFDMALSDLRDEAAHFLDGADIETEGQAEAIAKIVREAERIYRDADAARKAEKRPHDDAGKAVQARYLPKLDKANDIKRAAQTVLSRWLDRKEAERVAEAKRLADEAAAAKAAADALASAASLDDVTSAREAQAEAARLAKQAERVGNASVGIAADGRAVHHRTVWTATLVDPVAALRWAKDAHPDAIKALLSDLGAKAVRAGVRQIPGFIIEDERKVA